MLDERTASSREQLAERIACRLDLPVSIAGFALVVVLVADNLTPRASGLAEVWSVVAWVLWALFVVEFLLRLVVAPAKRAFLRRNWWQLAFLAVPFLRFLRSFTRTARLARVAATSVRTTRTAGRTLVGRLGWLGGATVATVLAAAEMLFQYGPGMTYGDALHAAALGAMGGEPIDAPGAVADLLELALVLHATLVFAALAGALGAFFLERARSPFGDVAEGSIVRRRTTRRRTSAAPRHRAAWSPRGG